MHLLADASIKKRLTAMITAASGVSVLLTTLTIAIIGIYNMKIGMIDEMKLSASIVGDRNAAALMFFDNEKVTQNLKVFDVNDSVRQACIYDREGQVFASYQKSDSRYTCPAAGTPRAEIKSSTLEVMSDIIYEGTKVGYIYIESDLRKIETYIEKQIYIAIMVMIAVMVVSTLIAVSLQRSISSPVLSLAATAREISVNKDYSIRAQPFGNKPAGDKNEIKMLTDSFNGMLQEISERDRLLLKQNVELERARDAAEAANRAKSQFLANISHELRTPLNAIIGFSSILMNQLFGALGDSKYLEYSKDINESGTHLLDIINDILDLAKAEAGKLELNYEEVNVPKAIAKCITILSERTGKGKITITTNIPKNLPTLYADRLRFIQILLNVLSNAVKFTEEGGKVHINIATRGELEEAPTHMIITITDTGIGMRREDIIKAFQSFGQLDSGLNRKYEGTGLGLPLTKMLMEQHKGMVELQSEIGIGTRVTLTLPIGSPPEAA